MPLSTHEEANSREFDHSVHAFIWLGLQWNRQLFLNEASGFVFDEEKEKWVIAVGPTWDMDDPYSDTLTMALFYPGADYMQGEELTPKQIERIDVVEFNKDAFTGDIGSLLQQTSRSCVAVITREPNESKCWEDEPDELYCADRPSETTAYLEQIADNFRDEMKDEIRCIRP